MTVFERFTGEARHVVVAAQEEARRRGDDWIGTEHLLVGLLCGATDGVVLVDHGVDLADVRRRIAVLVPGGDDRPALDADALASIGVDLVEVRRAAEAQFGSGALDRPRSPRRARFTRRSRKALELAVRAAQRSGQDRLRAGHLLLGVLAEGDGLAVRVLTDIGVDLVALRHDTEALLVDRAA